MGGLDSEKERIIEIKVRDFWENRDKERKQINCNK